MNFIIIHSSLVLKYVLGTMIMLRINLVDYIVLIKLVLMNQRHLQNISHLSVDVNLMVGNVTQGRNGTMVNVRSRKKKQSKKTIKHRISEDVYG